MIVSLPPKTPLEHFQWLLQRFPRADTLELMKMAFNRGVTMSIDVCDHKPRVQAYLFANLLGLDMTKLDPPLTDEDWRRGP